MINLLKCKQMRFMNKNITLLVCTVFFSFQNVLSQEEWVVPADKKGKVSPFKFTDETKKKGKKIFQSNCTSCHGTPGKGDFQKNLIPVPGDPATDKFQLQTDGALFYKITTGRGQMMAFKDALSDEERWQVISFIRSFNPKYVQPEPVEPPKGIYSGMSIDLKFDYETTGKKIKVTVNGTKEAKTNPLSGIEIKLFALRYFGNLPVDEPQTTDNNGIVYFNYKDSIPGDSLGNVAFLAKVNTEGLEGVKKDTLLKIGKVVIPKSLIDTRAMWTIRSQAPVWLILSYSLVVIGVWAVLFYIIYLIVQIRKKGKLPEQNRDNSEN